MWRFSAYNSFVFSGVNFFQLPAVNALQRRLNHKNAVIINVWRIRSDVRKECVACTVRFLYMKLSGRSSDVVFFAVAIFIMRKRSSYATIFGFFVSLTTSLTVDCPQMINKFANLSSTGSWISGGEPSPWNHTSLSTTSSPSPLPFNLSHASPVTLGAPRTGVYICDKEQFGQPNVTSCLDAISQMPSSAALQTFGDRQSQDEYNFRLPIRFSSGLWP